MEWCSFNYKGDDRVALLIGEDERGIECMLAWQVSKAGNQEPENVGLLMGMAWCYKRIDRLSRAIDSMEEAYRAHPDEAVVLYNLACYFSLAGNKPKALS